MSNLNLMINMQTKEQFLACVIWIYTLLYISVFFCVKSLITKIYIWTLQLN